VNSNAATAALRLAAEHQRAGRLEAACTAYLDAQQRKAASALPRAMDAAIEKIAGGETAGAVIQRLGILAIRIGPEIAPGVPWTESIGKLRIALALKSGNFGSQKFFQEALDLLN